MSLDREAVLSSAFAPNKYDADGLSVYRAMVHTPDEVARTFRTGGTKPVWIAHLYARDIVALGLSIQPDPLAASAQTPARPGHALIPELNTASAKSQHVAEIKHRLVQAVFQLDGPFEPP